MGRTLRRLVVIGAFTVAAAGLIGGVVLFVFAKQWLPPVDGLDGLDRTNTRLAYGCGIVSLIIGGTFLWAGISYAAEGRRQRVAREP
jgi:hypothetical protein